MSSLGGAANPADLRETCGGFIDQDLTNWLNTPGDPRSHIGAAFMLNKVPDLNSQNDPYTKCWNKVHNDLLRHGIQSQACAEYYFVDGVGFQVRFRPCDNW